MPVLRSYTLRTLFLIALSLPMSVMGQNNVRVIREEPLQTTRILFILDCSNSMYGRWQSDTKIKIAQTLLLNLLDSLENKKNVELALRAYGHLKNYPPQDCDDTRLEVPFSKNNHDAIRAKIKALVPRGTTPIAYSLERCADDFPEGYQCRNIIILITDGLEECGGDPCAISAALQKKGVALKPFVIGIGKGFREQLECIGTYYDAANEVEFSQALNTVIAQALNNTTGQVNLLDINGEPTETNAVMSFYDHNAKLLKYNYMHTINTRGLPDTLLLDPLLNYDIDIHTLPKRTITNKRLTPGKHTIMAAHTPQGSLLIKLQGKINFNTSPILSLIRLPNSHKTLNTQPLNKKEKYLVGAYNLEILTLPRIYLDSVTITQSSTVTVEIPSPGFALINKGKSGLIGSVFTFRDGIQEWIYNLDSEKTSETLMLQPGNYIVVLRSLYSSSSLHTKTQEFTIVSGENTKVTFTP